MSTEVLSQIDSTPLIEPGKDQKLQLYVHTLSGNSGTVWSYPSALVQSVCCAIEKKLGIAAASQQWLVGGDEVDFRRAATMAETSLASGTSITVVHTGFMPLVPLGEAFALELTSVRQRIRTGYSSAFVVIFKISGNTSGGWMHFEPWRKNDHDKFTFDIHNDTLEAETSHWMCGTSPSTRSLDGEDPLSKLRQAWCSGRQMSKDDERFWLPASAHDADKDDDNLPAARRQLLGLGSKDQEQTRPDHMAVPGWFVAPDEDCIEIETDIPLLNSGKRIIRILINRSGEPVRAALKGCQMAGLHQDIEEYDVDLSALLPSQEVVRRSGDDEE